MSVKDGGTRLMGKPDQKYKADKVKITNSLADKLKPQKKTPRPGDKGPRFNVSRLWDTKISGFLLQVGVGGTKTWYLRYRNKYDTPKSYKIGNYPTVKIDAARREATKKLGEVANEGDPQKDKRLNITSGTVAQYSKTYLKTLPWYKSKPTEEDIHKRFLLPALGTKKLQEVDREDIIAWLAQHDHLTGQWVKMRLYAQKFFAEMVINKRISSNPVSGVKIPKAKRYKPRKVVMTDNQRLKVKEFIKQQLKTKPAHCVYIALLLQVGCRPAELYERPWADVDLENETLDNVATKTDDDAKLVISPMAVKYFKQLKAITGHTKWCWPSQNDINKHHGSFKHFYGQLREYAGMEKVQMRDFRRTFISRSAKETADIHAISQSVGHADISITARVYDQVDDERQRAALKKAQNTLALI